MRRILSTGIMILSSLLSFGQSSDSNFLERFHDCDSTLTDFEVINQVFQYRGDANLSLNDGLLEEFQRLEQDSSFLKMEQKSSEILEANPVNLTASYYYTVSQLGLGKTENIKCSWNRTQMIHSAVMRFGKGSESEPFIVSNLNDAKALIYLFWAEGTKIDSLKTNKERLANVYITNSEGQNEIIRFDFNINLTIRELFFDYHRDFQFYLNASSDSESKYFYETLINRFLNQANSLKNNEIIALMIAFTNNQHYHPYKNVEVEREIMNLIEDKEYKKALKKCEKLLITNPLNFTALMEEGFSLMKIEDDRSYFPSTKSRKIVDAVLWSGNGSYDHPYFVLSPIDGQTIIRYIFGGTIGIMGSKNDVNGYFLDIIEMEKEETESIILHFNIDHAMNKSDIKKQINEILEKEDKE